jgi:glycosyltransferase involved in cell wall biosynthesis
MLLSAIMPTRDRRAFLPAAIECFLRQDYADRELVILDDGSDPVADLIPDDSRIRYLRDERRRNVGAKRNRLCEAARGEVIVHWDDDDWAADWRLRYQMESLLGSEADVCGLSRPLFHEPATDLWYEYRYPVQHRPWLYGATLCYRRTLWQRNQFADVRVGEDTRFVWAAAAGRLLAHDDPTFYVGRIHSGNTSAKRTGDFRWQALPPGTIPVPEARDAFRRSARVDGETAMALDRARAGRARA